ncbi:acyl-CoA dehydrogenase family protein [Novosphingobium resinovorum]|uniref:Acyl-CoA dehydrogenase n=1 Tax=Novosphingobium resinovorum TaxID=158500 RepID=A0A1D8A084_9SPHN|nr:MULTISPECIES: acyl-CoA dehydrogenase family protein [Novosphingobium]AOR75472.1 acyl-CoA dehydrogenase [Novosphingobium resinovorum]MBF7010786.1 acyl-CoA dehydrogenase family protein [Novosphingobium sp. HR1a]WJM28781.1 acyl-CoA dehydrogenase family protein [Novosphingobium resinovorum]
MDIELSPQDAAFRDEVRTFLRDYLPAEVKAGAAATPSVFVEPEIGQAWNAVLNKQGWLGYQWPAEHGGTGWTPLQRYLFEKECAAAGAPNLTVLGLKLLAPVIYNFGTDAQKAEVLPRILSGEDYWCQGFSEPGAGSDLASLKTRAVREGDHYRVNGSKIWTTHAHHANRMFTLVRTNTEVKKQAGISFLLIDLDTPGVSVRPILTNAGDHEVNQVFLEDVMVPAENLVGGEGDGWTIAKFLLENERGGSCHAPKLGYDLDQIEAAAKDESDGKGGILADQTDWRRRVAKARLSVNALEMIELKIISEIAKGRKAGPQTSLTKLLASNLRQEIDLLAVDLYGPAGLQLETARPLYGDNAPAAVHSKAAQVASARYLNSRAWTIFGGTNEVQSTIIAKSVLGL